MRMPTELCGESSCEGPWLSSSAGTAPGSSISRCTAAPSRCGRPPFQLTGNAMEFVLALHSHLPYVLNHGRWPHGSDWLCEAALDTYLPLLERLRELSAEGTAAPVTIGFTPVLANQLASPALRARWTRSSPSD